MLEHKVLYECGHNANFKKGKYTTTFSDPRTAPALWSGGSLILENKLLLKFREKIGE